MKVSCELIQDLLPLYYDEVCGEESRQIVEEHLKKCEKCKEDVRLMDDKIKAAPVHIKEQKITEAASSAWKKGKKRAFVKGILIVLLVFFIAITVQCIYHWNVSVDGEDIHGLAEQAASYYGYKELSIVKMEQRGDYIAAICTNVNGIWSMCVFERDEVFKNRWCASGGNPSYAQGEIVAWNYGSPQGEAVIIFSGANLPEEVCWYKFQNDNKTYICPIDEEVILDLFVIPDGNANSHPILLNKDFEEIRPGN